MNRAHRLSPFYTVFTWLLVGLMVEPQTRVVGQESSTYIRALEVLLAPTPSRGAANQAPILLAQAQTPSVPLELLSSAAARGNGGSSVTDTNFLLGLTRTPITLTNGNQLLSLSFFSDSNHNYVVEYRDTIGQDLCDNWQPLTNAPHNYGIIFTDNQTSNRFFRLRRIDVPRSPLFALLANDTGTNSLDGITSDPTVMGMTLEFPEGTLLQGSLDQPGGPFTTITNLGPPRHFIITPEQLATINGGFIPDGPHVLHLRAEPASGNPPFDTRNSTFALPFTLDTTPPTVSVQLAQGFDSPPLGDGRTTFNPVTLIGQSEPGARLELLAAASPSPGGLSLRTLLITLYLYINRLCILWRDA